MKNQAEKVFPFLSKNLKTGIKLICRGNRLYAVSILYELKDPVKDSVNDKIDALNIKEEDISIKKLS